VMDWFRALGLYLEQDARDGDEGVTRVTDTRFGSHFYALAIKLGRIRTMATKGLGICPEADPGMADCIRAIFSNSGIAPANYAIAKARFVAKPKPAVTEKGNTVPIDRLRYQLATETVSPRRGETGKKLANGLITAGDQVHVVWVAHGNYNTDPNDDEVNSIKFMPHHGTGVRSADVRMSAKELARTIYDICKTPRGQRVYPASLTVASCHAGNDRMDVITEKGVQGNGRKFRADIAVSRSDMPLGLRVLQHLHRMFQPPPSTECYVAAPLRSMEVTWLRHLAVPISPTDDDWMWGTL
jgi:hypothetical protein